MMRPSLDQTETVGSQTDEEETTASSAYDGREVVVETPRAAAAMAPTLPNHLRLLLLLLLALLLPSVDSSLQALPTRDMRWKIACRCCCDDIRCVTVNVFVVHDHDPSCSRKHSNAAKICDLCNTIVQLLD